MFLCDVICRQRTINVVLISILVKVESFALYFSEDSFSLSFVLTSFNNTSKYIFVLLYIISVHSKNLTSFPLACHTYATGLTGSQQSCRRPPCLSFRQTPNLKSQNAKILSIRSSILWRVCRTLWYVFAIVESHLSSNDLSTSRCMYTLLATSPSSSIPCLPLSPSLSLSFHPSFISDRKKR